MISLVCDWWNAFLNNIRMISPTAKGFIILGLLLSTFFFLAMSINKGKNHTERPIKWLPLAVSILSFGIAIFITVV